MKISKFRFKFQISKKTDFPTSIIVEKILAKLKNKKYSILDVTDNSITFEKNPFRLVWNFQAPYILDEGDFKIYQIRAGNDSSFKLLFQYFVPVGERNCVSNYFYYKRLVFGCIIFLGYVI